MLTAFDNIIKIQKYFVNDCASVGKKVASIARCFKTKEPTKALWLDVAGGMTSFIQLECFVSTKRSCSMLQGLFKTLT